MVLLNSLHSEAKKSKFQNIFKFLCDKVECYHCARKSQVVDRIFKLNPMHASAIYLRFSEFAEFTDFNESSSPLSANSNGDFP